MRRRMDNARAGDAGVVVRSGNAFAKQNSRNDDETQFRPGVDECVEQPIRVELSERRRRSGDTFSVAACDFAEDASTAGPICGLARKLLARGVDPARHLSIWRGETKCFHDVPVGRWAELTVEEGSEPVFRRYKPFPRRAVASQRAKSGVRHG